MSEEIIKIVRPDEKLMGAKVSDEKLEELEDAIRKAIENDELGKDDLKPIKEALDPDAVMTMIAGGAMLIPIIALMIKTIKDKYRLTVQKIYTQSKELNDIYTKVNDMLKHDKMARWKHRNDKMDASFEDIVMRDKKDQRKVYQLTLDLTAYDPEFFLKEINDMVSFANQEDPSKRIETLKNMSESLMQDIDDSFAAKHWFVRQCEPLLRKADYKGMRLEDVLTKYKNWISECYNVLYMYNDLINTELKYMGYIQQAYNKCSNSYHNDKAVKEIVDKVFKKILANTQMSMDFNNNCMTIINEIMKFYTDELTKIYDYIRH